MENRIRRLEFEEKRSVKMEKLANKRAESMIEARKRHFEDLLMKKNHYYDLAKQEEHQRELNEKRKKDRKTMIKLARVEAITNNKISKDETLNEVTEARIKSEKLNQIELEKQKEVKLRQFI